MSETCKCRHVGSRQAHHTGKLINYNGALLARQLVHTFNCPTMPVGPIDEVACKTDRTQLLHIANICIQYAYNMYTIKIMIISVSSV